ncbi:acyl-CoA dehydrogenase family protein [Actinacidiphila yeochonensis]|uniref:acyl-CoA dehydrogenase family protein n=1 Tax=Actinacidiphila yeochonensis TaxID=89050 RepID=UPI00056D6F87|nr:acyl-CoA dehydrogenase family protein [Actinacidiphila yeochonensis]
MQSTAIPTHAELVERARALVPLLREQAVRAEQEARLTDEVVAALTEAGIFRMRLPARFGGYECDTATLVDVSIELGRGDGSVAFDVVAWWIMSWNIGQFADEAQEEVFADPDVRICGTLAPTATATPTEGGLLVSGSWAFNSGAAHSSWKLLSAILPTPDGGALPIMALAPIDRFDVVEDWRVSGLRGTGSVTLNGRDVFVPDGFHIPIPAMLQQQYATKLNADSPMYRAPVVGAVGAATCGKLIGLARAAQEDFLERASKRPITNTTYERQLDAPVTHLEVAEAALLTDEAEFHARKLASMVDGKAAAGQEWTLQERAYARVAVGRVCQLTARAVDLIAGASGASSIYSDQLVQRIRRDVQAINIHALNLPSTNLELYGRVLCGLEPNTFFV